MANPEHLAILMQGVDAWNERAKDFIAQGVVADLSGADLGGATLSGANLFRADLSGANLAGTLLDGAVLSEANLHQANLRKANLCEAMAHWVFLPEADLTEAIVSRAYLREANLRYATLKETDLVEADLLGADLEWADLAGARLIRANLQRAMLERTDLRGANLNSANLAYSTLHCATLTSAELIWANLAGANLSGADLSGSELEGARIVGTDLRGTDLTGCRIYGIAAWNVEVDESTVQENLVVTPSREPSVSVDRLEVAQFVYLLLSNAKIRDVIETVGRKAVLILGRFTPDRKTVLDAIRDALRQRGYVPILFDFEGPDSRDLTETVSILAHLSRFVVADLTDARSLPQELQAVVPNLLSVPIQPLILEGERAWGMYADHFPRYPWVLPTLQYRDVESLLLNLDEHVIRPAEAKAKQLTSSQGG